MALARPLLIAAAFVLATTAAKPAAADPIVLDQRYLPPPGWPGIGSTAALTSFPFPDFSFRRAQTFTVGREGRLTRVDVLLETSKLADVRLQILDTSASVPTFTVLGGSRTGTAQADGWWTFELAAGGIPVRTGKTLGIEVVLSTLGGGAFATWLGQSPGGYSGGGDFYNNGEPSFLANPQLDNFFRTYQDISAPVPEPGTMILLGSGLSGLILSACRRRKLRNEKLSAFRVASHAVTVRRIHCLRSPASQCQ
jgi:hypothetical protein